MVVKAAGNDGTALTGELGATEQRWQLALAGSNLGVADWNLDGALCLRNLVTGSDDWAKRLQAGVDEARRNGNLRGKPAIIVHGRNDALLPVNHTSRPYVALNRKVEGSGSKLSYVEVTNAQHFDAFIGLPTIRLRGLYLASRFYRGAE